MRPKVWVGLTLTALSLAACSEVGGFSTKSEQVYAPGPAARKKVQVDPLTVGHRMMAAGQHEMALKAYYRAAADEGLTADVLTAMGSANLGLGRLGQAEKFLRRAVQEDESFAPAWNNLGVVLMETGQIAEAERVFHRAFALDSGNSPQIQENLRLALAKLENPAYDAENKYNFALVRRGGGDWRLHSVP